MSFAGFVVFFYHEGNEGNEVFVHYSSIISPTDRTLSKGQDVQFEITEGEQGPEACEVKATSE